MPPQRAPGRPRARHPSLDGLRGIAVAAVFLFHAQVSWAPGGYLGVDVFFVLSGFLITSLLLGELHTTDRLDLLRFWTRRTARLLPALLVLVLVSVMFGAFFAPGESPAELHGDALATLAQVVNWRLIDSVGHSLVGAVRSPFQHCWSLSIEAQFYLAWPLVVWAVAAGGGRRRRRRNVGLVAAALSLGSIVAMVLLVGPDWHTQRAYYGTDARAQSLLIGAVLAALIGPRLTGEHRPSSGLSTLAVTGAGTLAAGGLVAAFLMAPTSGDTMYEGWYAVVAIAAAVVLAQLVMAPQTTVASTLSAAPLVGLGRISYSLYLWHWPLFLVLDETRTGLTGGPLFAVRVVVSLVVATASYRFVEQRFHGARSRARESGRALTVRVPRRAASTSVSGRGDGH